jgi:hypothetical protein
MPAIRGYRLTGLGYLGLIMLMAFLYFSFSEPVATAKLIRGQRITVS